MRNKVCIVDDSLIAGLMIKKVLEDHGFEVVATYRNGEDFIEAIKGGLMPDVVIMDLVLPKMSGTEAIMKAKELYCSAKFIVVSSLGGSTSEFCSAIEAGADDVVAKPYQEETLVEVVKKALAT